MDSNNNIKQEQEKIICYLKFVKSTIIGDVEIDGVCVFKTSRILIYNNNNFEVFVSKTRLKCI